jgi:hypothetical protein
MGIYSMRVIVTDEVPLKNLEILRIPLNLRTPLINHPPSNPHNLTILMNTVNHPLQILNQSQM